VLGCILAVASIGTACADPPPDDLHALLTCYPQGGHFMMKTRESGTPFDETSDGTADPDVTVHFDLRQRTPYQCRLPGFVIGVRVDNYNPGNVRGECAVWEKGVFTVTVNGHSYAQIFAPQCIETTRHDLDIQVKTIAGGGHELWSIDCSYKSNYNVTVDEAVCVNLPKNPAS